MRVYRIERRADATLALAVVSGIATRGDDKLPVEVVEVDDERIAAAERVFSVFLAVGQMTPATARSPPLVRLHFHVRPLFLLLLRENLQCVLDCAAIMPLS